MDTTGSTPPFRLPSELKRLLATPGTLSGWTGQQVRTLYSNASINFVPQRDLSTFGRYVFSGNLEAVKQEYERSHPDLSGTETCFQTGYVSIAVLGSQRMNFTNPPVGYSHAKVIVYLVLQGTPVDTPDIVGRTALHHSASNNRVAKVLNAIFTGDPNPNSRERYGTTPLHCAVMNSQAEVVELCLAKGGDMNAKDGDEVTPTDMLRRVSPAVNAIVARHSRGKQGTTALIEGTGTCIVCGKTGSVKQCTRCHIARYCGQECQRIHWKNGHKLECVAFDDAEATLSFKPNFTEQKVVIPNSDLLSYSSITGQPDGEALRKAEQARRKEAKDSKKSTISRHSDLIGKHLILKVQIPAKPGAEQQAGMLVYNKARDLTCDIFPTGQTAQFGVLEKKIRESGWMGIKGYFMGVLEDEQTLKIKAKDILAPQPWSRLRAGGPDIAQANRRDYSWDGSPLGWQGAPQTQTPTQPVVPVQPSIMNHSACSHEPEDELWNKTNPDIEALKSIIGDHFNSLCQTEEAMNHGAYARVFLYTLQNGLQVVARVILPVRENIKTESEIAAMDMVRARTSVPVPKVHLYCSTPHNPVRVEWILMDYVPGKRFVDCFEELSYGQKNKTAADMAFIMSEIFSFTSHHCGTLLCDQSLTRDQRSRRHNDVDIGHISTESHSEVSDGSFLIGPVNDVTFLEHRNVIPSAKCGPFSTERQFLEAFAYLGSPGTRPSDKLERWPFEKLFEVYDVVRSKYPVSKGDLKTFHFAHGDLSVANILLDPKTGAITGVIDWEMAGFRPAWLAAACPTWFDDDSCRFVMEAYQDGPDGYGDETEDEAQLRQHFSSELEVRNQELFQNNRQGVELRAMFYNLGNEYSSNVETWLQRYERYHWDLGVRGPFPFDLMQWIEDRVDLYERSRGRR